MKPPRTYTLCHGALPRGILFGLYEPRGMSRKPFQNEPGLQKIQRETLRVALQTDAIAKRANALFLHYGRMFGSDLPHIPINIVAHLLHVAKKQHMPAVCLQENCRHDLRFFD